MTLHANEAMMWANVGSLSAENMLSGFRMVAIQHQGISSKNICIGEMNSACKANIDHYCKFHNLDLLGRRCVNDQPGVAHSFARLFSMFMMKNIHLTNMFLLATICEGRNRWRRDL